MTRNNWKNPSHAEGGFSTTTQEVRINGEDQWVVITYTYKWDIPCGLYQPIDPITQSILAIQVARITSQDAWVPNSWFFLLKMIMTWGVKWGGNYHQFKGNTAPNYRPSNSDRLKKPRAKLSFELPPRKRCSRPSVGVSWSFIWYINSQLLGLDHPSGCK